MSSYKSSFFASWFILPPSLNIEDSVPKSASELLWDSPEVCLVLSQLSSLLKATRPSTAFIPCRGDSPRSTLTASIGQKQPGPG